MILMIMMTIMIMMIMINDNDDDNDNDNEGNVDDYDEQTMKMTCNKLPVHSETDGGAHEWIRVNKVHRPVDRVDDPCRGRGVRGDQPVL